MPVDYILRCAVPGCERRWHCVGPRSGFIVAGAKAHAGSHWIRFHREGKHVAEDFWMCPQCIAGCYKGMKGRFDAVVLVWRES